MCQNSLSRVEHLKDSIVTATHAPVFWTHSANSEGHLQPDLLTFIYILCPVSLEFFIDIILPITLWPWGWLSL